MFKFKLQTLLKFREKFEEDKKNELALALQTHLIEVSTLEKIQKEQSELEEYLCSKTCLDVKQKMDLIEMERWRTYYFYLEQRKKEQHQRVLETDKVVASKRETLITASKEKQMIEILKEKDFESYKHKMLLIEQKKIDELVSFKFSTNSSL